MLPTLPQRGPTKCQFHHKGPASIRMKLRGSVSFQQHMVQNALFHPNPLHNYTSLSGLGVISIALGVISIAINNEEM